MCHRARGNFLPVRNRAGKPLVSEALQRGCAEGLHLVNLRLHVDKRLQGLWLLRFQTEDIIHTHAIAKHWGIPHADADMHISGGGWILQVGDEALDLRGHAGLEVEHLAAPQISLLEDGQLNAGDDAEVVRAASERNPQVLVALCVGVDNLAAGKNNLVVDYVITDEAARIRVV